MDATPTSAMQNYKAAIDALYQQPSGEKPHRGEAQMAAGPALEEQVQFLVERSQDVGQVVAQSLDSADSGVRELAELQLLAAAAIDLQVANDLVENEGRQATGARRSRAVPGGIRDLQKILDTPTEAGIQALPAGKAKRRAAPPKTVEAARKKLAETVETALDGISDDASSIGQVMVTNLLKLAPKAVEDGAKEIVGHILEKLGEKASALVAKAVSLVSQAIDKLLKIIGKQREDDARSKAKEWIDELRSGGLFKTIVTRLYQTDRILAEVNSQIEKAPAGLAADKFNLAGEQVASLAASYHRQKEVLTWVVTGLGVATPWLMGLHPWGPVGLATGYLLTVGFVVYSGGDHVDWYLAGSRLNATPGVRTLVKKGLAA